MEGTLFSTIPPEINTLILATLSDSQLFSLCQNDIFSDLCDWSFWRSRARETFDVPNWYFDLNSSRGISGAYRYLEIKTQFMPSIESLAEVDQGIVFGITELENLFEQAIITLNYSLVEQLIPVYLERFPSDDVALLLGGFYKSLSTGKYSNRWELIPMRLFLVKIMTGLPNVLETVISEFSEGQPQQRESFFSLINQEIVKKDWKSVTESLKTNRDQDDGTDVLIYLIYLQDPQAFSIIKELTPLLENNNKVQLSRATAQVGNYEQFQWIYSQINWNQVEFKVGIGSSELNSIAGGLHSDYFSPYNLLYDAYIGANPMIIEQFEKSVEQFEKLGFTISRQSDKIAALVAGRKNYLSNPISVYQIVDKLTINDTFEIDDLVGLGIEVISLLSQKFPDLIDYYSLLDEATRQGNVDVTNWLILKNLPLENGFEDIQYGVNIFGYHNIVIDKIFESYIEEYSQ